MKPQILEFVLLGSVLLGSTPQLQFCEPVTGFADKEIDPCLGIVSIMPSSAVRRCKAVVAKKNEWLP
jgi:hypothetical protein